MVDAFSLPGSRPLGCLLVHGFTGTPEEMRPLGEALAARGFPVYAVRLAGHGTDVADPAMRAASRSYRMTPLAGVTELLRLQVVVRRELSRVTQPALVLHGRQDHSVPFANLELLRRSLGSSWIETRVLERSWHVITMDVERDEVGRLAADFL